MKQAACKNGFSLVELIFTLAIAMIFITLAVPSFTTFSKNNRVTSVTNELITDINLARSEALSRGVRVILCRSGDPAASSPTCGGSANTWTTGWLLFASGDTNNTFNAGTDRLISVAQAVPGDIVIKANNISNSNLTYSPDGTTSEAGGTGIFAICDDRGLAYGNQIQIIPTGRPRLISPVPASCSSPT